MNASVSPVGRRGFARIVWIAILATLAHAFMPAAHSRTQPSGGVAAVLCSAEGVRLVLLDAGVPEGKGAAEGASCDWCLSGAGPALPGASHRSPCFDPAGLQPSASVAGGRVPAFEPDPARRERAPPVV